MIKLGLPFQSGMILQRREKVAVWGTSDKKQLISVSLNGKKILKQLIPTGEFKFYLPAQEAMESATLQIGDIMLTNIDFGEVWIAGGQSNMQFYVKWDAEREFIYEQAADNHLRYFEVAKYTFEGEEKDGFKDDSRWDKWLCFNHENSPFFSSAATFFALELRKKLGVPIGIISCSYGGTSASTWMDDRLLRGDEKLKIYTEEYEKSLEGLNLERYYAMNRMMRQNMSTGGEEADDYMHRTVGITIEEFYNFMATKKIFKSDDREEEKYSTEELMRPGPNEPHPGSLYRTMLKKIIGYTSKGVIWYQGCNDENRAEIYKNLFEKLIKCWRDNWGYELPFIFAQLAPFGSWFGNTGINFPKIRRAQEEVQKTVSQVYMISTSDIGCENDIHPKNKRKIGQRMALQALDKIYSIKVMADSPQYCGYNLKGSTLTLQFAFGEGLYILGKRLKNFELICDGNIVDSYSVKLAGNTLKLISENLRKANLISVRYAQTPYYEINLYNGAGLPAFPFELNIIGG